MTGCSVPSSQRDAERMTESQGRAVVDAYENKSGREVLFQIRQQWADEDAANLEPTVSNIDTLCDTVADPGMLDDDES